jgi:hypothetical protein
MREQVAVQRIDGDGDGGDGGDADRDTGRDAGRDADGVQDGGVQDGGVLSPDDLAARAEEHER